MPFDSLRFKRHGRPVGCSPDSASQPMRCRQHKEAHYLDAVSKYAMRVPQWSPPRARSPNYREMLRPLVDSPFNRIFEPRRCSNRRPPHSAGELTGLLQPGTLMQRGAAKRSLMAPSARQLLAKACVKASLVGSPWDETRRNQAGQPKARWSRGFEAIDRRYECDGDSCGGPPGRGQHDRTTGEDRV